MYHDPKDVFAALPNVQTIWVTKDGNFHLHPHNGGEEINRSELVDNGGEEIKEEIKEIDEKIDELFDERKKIKPPFEKKVKKANK